MEESYIHLRDEGRPGAPLILTFHGTGGDEHQFAGFARELFPDAHIVSPRGDVSERGAARFFRRTGEGVYDMEDLAARVTKMAGFVAAHVARTKALRVIALGYSNGANIAAAVSFRHPEVFTDLILMHPLIPFDPGPQPGLSGTRVLVTAGRRDPICPVPLTERLIGYFQTQGAKTDTFWHQGGHEITRDEMSAIAAFATRHGDAE